jgi:LysM repeat protein
MVGRVVRWLAPIALIAVGVAIYLVVHATVAKDHNTASQSHAAHHHHKGHHHAPKKKSTFYIVQAGDTLSGIAVKNHITLTKLEDLNPNVSSNSLQTGTKLRLRR